MSTATYSIHGGDFERAGAASKGLKEMLKKVGVEAKTVRRAMIAAYEAEMNVVIHAGGGMMEATLDGDRLDLLVADQGPGIPDIALAMQEGFSTAPESARELGFGAGMGLPNIKRNSDQFEIESNIGQGTRLKITIYLRPQTTYATARHSLHIAKELCTGCLQCLRACPTGALRLREDRPALLEHLCVDCTNCISVCEPHVYSVAGAEETLPSGPGAAVVVPMGFLTQFGAEVSPEHVMEALQELGFAQVRVMEEWEAALRVSVREYAREDSERQPVLSPCCPAVINLVEMRFPSLLGHVAPLLSPVEAAREALREGPAGYLVGCPSQRTALGITMRTLSPVGLYNALAPRVRELAAKAPRRAAEKPAAEEASVLRVTGLSHVLRVLEELENGHRLDAEILELYACDQGCIGSPLWREDPYLAQERGALLAMRAPAGTAVPRRDAPRLPRAGTRLDENMARAMAKLAEIDRLTKELPGRNCGVCGAPSCASLAEDVVFGRAVITACPYRVKQEEAPE